MHGAPVIQDYLETTLRDWTDGRIAVIQRWIDEGKMAPINPRHLLYMLWATTQHYADFGHQIQTLNDGKPLSDKQWREAKASVKDMVLRGIGAI
jgi:TetR/AcrR family transcriptional regulator